MKYIFSRRQALASTMAAIGLRSAILDSAAAKNKQDGRSIRLEDFGASRERRDNSDAWALALKAASDEGVPIKLSGGGVFKIPNAEPKEITNPIDISGDGITVLEGAPAQGFSAPTLFIPICSRLSFTGIITKNLTLIDSVNKITGYDCDIRLAQWRAFNTLPILNIRLRASNPLSGLKRLIIEDVVINGGSGGLHFLCQILNGSIGISRPVIVKNIKVPNLEKFFRGRDMAATGVGAGIVLGYALHNGQYPGHKGGVALGMLEAQNIKDSRIVKPGGTPSASTDGVRIQLPDVTIESVRVSQIETGWPTDTTGFYSKSRNMIVKNFTSVDCGRSEAALVLKGAGGKSNDLRRFNNVEIVSSQPGYNRRVAIALYSVPNVYFDNVLIKNMGGDIEDPEAPGKRLAGTRGVIYCASGEKESLNFRSLNITDCIVGAPEGEDAVLIHLQGYKRILIEELIIDGASSEGRFTKYNINARKNLNLLNIIARNSEIDSLIINRMHVRNIKTTNGSVATAINICSGSGAIKSIQVHDINMDDSCDFIMRTAVNSKPIEKLIIGGRHICPSKFLFGKRPMNFNNVTKK